MKPHTLILSAIAAIGILTTPCARAQPRYDVIHITFPYAVTVGDKTMPPGDYMIQELRSEDPIVLLFYNGNGMKFETSAITNKAFDPNTARSTAVTLRQIGENYFLDTLWIQGKSFGFEFQLPPGVMTEK